MNFETLLETASTRKRLPSPAVRRLLREAARLTQNEVADCLGVDRATVSRWESGRRNPRGSTAVRYVQLLEQLGEQP